MHCVCMHCVCCMQAEQVMLLLQAQQLIASLEVQLGERTEQLVQRTDELREVQRAHAVSKVGAGVLVVACLLACIAPSCTHPASSH